MTTYQVLLTLLLLAGFFKAVEIAWMIYSDRQFRKTLDRLDRDNQEVMDWFERLKAEREQWIKARKEE